MKSNPFLFYLFWIFVILNIGDIISTQFIVAGESNPIYLITHSLWPLYLLKIFAITMMGIYVHRNIFPSNMMYYIFVSILVLGNIMLLIAICSNSYAAIYAPHLIEEASKMPAAEKAAGYAQLISFIVFLPMILSLMCFFFYDHSYKYVKIDKAYYKAKRWWQI